MVTRSLPLISFPPPSPPRPSINPKTTAYRIPNFSSDLPFSSPNSVAVGAPRARRDSEAETTRRERFGSSSKFDFAKEVRSRANRRKWWSDDDEDDDDDDDGDGGLFGLWEDPRTSDLVMKVLGTFGWIIPNLIMSSMMDTGIKGQDALFMALMLPLGQVVISLVMDNIRGSSGRRRKRKPFGRARSRTRPGNKSRKRNYQTAQGRAAYQPWSDNSCAKSSSSFGGWDELDQQVRNFGDLHERPPSEDAKLNEVRNVETE